MNMFIIHYVLCACVIYVVMWAKKKKKAIVNYFLEKTAAAKVIGNC